MIIGAVYLEMLLLDSGSLKDKRMILRSLKQQVRSRFNVAIAEIDDHDKWQRTTLACVSVGTSKASVNSLLSCAAQFIEMHKHIQLLDYELELF